LLKFTIVHDSVEVVRNHNRLNGNIGESF
jgi:hypothetical protein